MSWLERLTGGFKKTADRLGENISGLVKARAARLRHAAQGRRSRWLDGLVGTCQTVLIENSEKGHSDGFAPLSIEGSRRGDLGRARVIGRDEDHLVGIFE